MEKASKEYFETFGIDRVLDKVKNSKIVKSLTAVGMLAGGATACVNKTPVVEAAPLPSADETSTPSIEKTPTETLNMETGQLENAETAETEMVRRINAFLAGEGEYSDNALADKIFLCDISGSEKDLGFIFYAPDEAAHVQGVNLGVYSDNEKLVVMFGTKSVNGQRIVIPIYRDLEGFKYMKTMFSQLDNRAYSWVGHDESRDLLVDNPEDFIAEIQNRLNEPFAITIIFTDQSGAFNWLADTKGLSDLERSNLIKRVNNDTLLASDWLKVVAKNYSEWDIGNEFNGDYEDLSFVVYSSPINKLEIPPKEKMTSINSMTFRLEE